MFDILVVDDDKNTRYLMETVLNSEGFSVRTATNGREALSVLDEANIDLIILDIIVPLSVNHKNVYFSICNC